MATPIKIEGVNKIIRKLNELENKAKKKVIRTALRNGMKIIQDKARADSPVDKGRLRKSIKIKTMKRKKDRLGLSLIISTKTMKVDDIKDFHGAAVELGHEGIEGKHTFQQASKTSEEKVLQQVNQDLKTGLITGA